MRECNVCGEKDFEEHDGLYFCTICNTQSQDARVMLAEEEDFDNFRRSGIIKEPSTPKQKKKNITDHGRPWSVYEAYQIIIQHQVNALIKLGAQESLREIVFQIWTSYLCRLGVAFSTSDVNNVKYERQRELFPSTTNRPVIKNVLGKLSRRKTLGQSAKEAQKKRERDQTESALQGEEFYDEDNPLNDSVDADPDSQGEEIKDNDDEDEPRWGRYRKSLKFDSVEKVRMTSTIAVCYLGLMYTNPLITATDLLRWIQNKKIPYLDVKSILPEDMKFYLNDWKLFGLGSMPTLEQLRHTTGSIAYYIGLRNFPEFPLEELINKYIIQLDLPVEFHGYAMNVFRNMQVHIRYDPISNRKTTIFWEGVAMAYIVITLKLLFGFDDSNEILMSEYSKELSNISECAKPLFIWTDWVQHMKNKIYIEQQLKSKTADKKLACSHLRHRVEATSYVKNVTMYKKSFRESLARPFLGLSSRWNSRMTADRVVASTQNDRADDNASDDLLLDFNVSTLEEVDTPLDTLLGQDSPGQNQSSFQSGQDEREIQLKGDCFRKSTVQHLIHPDTYLTDVQEKLGQPEDPLETASKYSISEAIISDFYDSQTSRKQRKRKYSTDTLGEEEVAMNDKLEEYQAVIEKLNEVRKNVKASLEFETKALCLSYDWLVKICCLLIDCETEMLRDLIYKLEVMFFAEPEDCCLNIKEQKIRQKLRSNPQTFLSTLHRM